METINETSCNQDDVNDNENENNEKNKDNLNEQDKELESDYNIENNSSDVSLETLEHPRVAVEPNRDKVVDQIEENQEELQENRDTDINVPDQENSNENSRKRPINQDLRDSDTESNSQPVQKNVETIENSTDNVSYGDQLVLADDNEILNASVDTNLKGTQNQNKSNNDAVEKQAQDKQHKPIKSNSKDSNKIQNYKVNRRNQRKFTKRKKHEEENTESSSNPSNNEDVESSNALKRTRKKKRNSIANEDNSTTDSELEKENKRRKINNEAVIKIPKLVTKSRNVKNANNPTSTTNNLRKNNLKRNNCKEKSNNNTPVKSSNIIRTDSESSSPKRKKLKVVSLKVTEINNLNDSNNLGNNQNVQRKSLRRKMSRDLIVNLKRLDIAKTIEITGMQKKNVDGTMSFSNVTLSDNSFKPAVESTVINNGTLSGKCNYVVTHFF